MSSWSDTSPGMLAGKLPVNGQPPAENDSKYPLPQHKRKKVVVVGLGMVGIAFMWVSATWRLAILQDLY